MHVFQLRRTLPRVGSAVLAGATAVVLSVPAAAAAVPARPDAPAMPSDTYRSQQWTLDALHVTRAWKYSRGSGVTVAVLDTGVDGHQADLSGRVVDGPDFTGHARAPGGRYWGRHGTEMASLIAGHGHGAGAAGGVMGVAPDAKVLSVRVTWELTDPIRTDQAQVGRARDAVAQGIRYAADHGAQVISMSLGGGNLFYNGNAAEEAAIKYALGKGSVLVASAGNDGDAANRRNYPAAYPGVIAVGAVDRQFKPAKFTNRHTYISVAAPGVNIVSADSAGHGYILGTGTSSSAAFVAGMSALVKARYPSLTPAEVKQALEEGATHRPPDGRSTEIGTGVVDAYGALRTAARINKAEHSGAAADRPATGGGTKTPASKHGPDLLLIAVLSGGGTLILLSLILGWRQRRRRPAAADDEDESDEESAAPPVAAHAAEPARDRRPGGVPQRATGASSGLSPWERRPETAARDETPMWGTGTPPEAPWERRHEAPAPADSWDQPEVPSPGKPWDQHTASADSWERREPADSWERPSSELPHSWDRSSAGELPHSWDHRPPEDEEHTPWEPEASYDRRPPETPPPGWDPRPDEAPPSAGWDPQAPPPGWDPASDDAPPASWDRQQPSSVWDPAPDNAPPSGAWDRQPPPASWDSAPGNAPPSASWDPGPDNAPPSAFRDRRRSEPSEPPEPPAPAGWDPTPGDASASASWDPLTDDWDRRPPETDAPSGWDDPTPSDTPQSAAWDRLSDDWNRPAAEPTSPPEPAPYDPHAADSSSNGNGSGANGRYPSRDFRVAGGKEPDPLNDGTVDSSAEVGTPLAEESWDSIRRGFDRLKDANNWESLAGGGGIGDENGPASDAFDETAAMPIIEPDDEGGNDTRGGPRGG